MIETARQVKKATRVEARRLRREAYARDLERPVRWAIRFSAPRQETAYVVSTDPRELPTDDCVRIGARVMGTHESLDHAKRRLGWE